MPFSFKFRQSLLFKLAQTTSATTSTLPDPSKTVSGAPPSFSAWQLYHSLIVGFDARNATIINALANTLNQALFYSTNGQLNMQWLRQQNFNVQADQYTPDVKNLVNFAKLVYQNLFTNNGEDFDQPLTPHQIAEKVNLLSTSTSLNNLSATSPSSQLSVKVGGNLREVIKNTLVQIK